MASAPLFYSTRDALKEGMRLGPSCNTSADPIIDECMLKARLRIYAELGDVRVGELLAITEVENPTTANERLRSSASLLELTMVRCCLQERLPQVFLDKSGDIHQQWDYDGMTREASEYDLHAQRLNCSSEINRLLDVLADGKDDNPCGVQVFITGPEAADRLKLGQSIKPCNPNRLRGDI